MDNLPAAWPTKALGKVAKIERTSVTPERILDGSLYVGLENITGDGGFDSVREVANGELASNKFEFTASHVLYGKLRPYLSKIARPEFSGICSTDILPILPGRDVDRDYLYYFLRQPEMVQYATTRSTGANLPRLSPKQLAEFPIPLPKLEEQKRIAAILDKAASIRHKRQEARDIADKFLEAAYVGVFGSPITNANGWPIEPLGNYLEFLTSGSRGWAQHYVPEGKRFIRSLDVKMNRISADDAVYVDPPAGAEADRTRVQPHDVLLTITGSQIGRVAFVPTDIDEAYVSQHVAILRLSERLLDRFVSMFLSLSAGGQLQIAKQQYGQTKPGLSLAQIRTFDIPVPPVALQQRFLNIWDKFADVQLGLTNSEQETNSLFNALVQRAFNGEL